MPLLGIYVFALASMCTSIQAINVLGIDILLEFVMDLNKPPFPIVNVIADKPSLTVGSAELMKSERLNEVARAKAAEEGKSRYEESAAHELYKQNDLLARLTNLTRIVSKFR